MDSLNEQLLPTYYDGTQLVIRVQLPDRDLTIEHVYDHVSGMRLDDGAKPWPFYRDANTGQWWSLNTNANTPIDRLVWMIPLEQLRYKPRPEAEHFLDTVYAELENAAKEFGGSSEPECNVDDALSKMDGVAELLAVRDTEVVILVRAPDGGAYTVADWWQACEKSGLTYGDGNLFWLLNESASEDNDEPYEYFSVEPYSQSGYFHLGDLSSPVMFPDVAFSFRVRDFADPSGVLDKMVAMATSVADHLGADLLAPDGSAFDATDTRQRLDHAIERLRALEDAK